MARMLRLMVVPSFAALVVLGSPVAGQAPDQMPFCAILTGAEVSAEVGADVGPIRGDERSCNYASTQSNVFTSLHVANGGTLMDLARSTHSDGEDAMVADQPAWISASGFSNLLYIDRGDGDTLSFQLISPPDAVDPAAALVALGELAFPRLATLATPTPVVQADPELAGLFPTAVGDTPFPVQTFGGETMTSNSDPEALAKFEELLASNGKSFADVTGGFGLLAEPPVSISAMRIRGADITPFMELLLGMAAQEAGVTPTPVQVAGKDMQTALLNGQQQYVYPKGEVMWLVVAEEPLLTEVFQKLP